MNANMHQLLQPAKTRGTPRFSWRPSRATLRLRLYLLLALTDVAVLTLSIALASVALHGFGLDAGALLLVRVLTPFYLVIATFTGAISISSGMRAGVGIGRSCRAVTLTYVAFVLLAFSLKTTSEMSRLLVGVSYTGAVVGLALARYCFARRAKKLLGGNPWDTILICDGVDDLTLPGDCNLVLHADASLSPFDRTPGMFDRLARLVGKADRVVVRCTPDRRAAWTAVLQGLNVQGEIQASELRHLSPQALSFSGSEPTIVVAQGPLRLKDRVLKRLMDVGISGAALLLLLPLLAAIAIAVRATSDGPVFFKQVRMGRQNRKFTMLKFRSMRVADTDHAGVRSTARDDDRITRVGRWLRRTSLDELPQLFNVLIGDMSVVGPRPHALSSTAADMLFWEIDPAYWDRHVIKPGLTGLAQVRGFRGATLLRDDLERRLSADMEYIRNWSLQLDALILLRTMMVLVHRNAY